MKRKILLIGDNQTKVYKGLKNAFESLELEVIEYNKGIIPKTTSIKVNQDLDLILVIEIKKRQFSIETNKPTILYLQDSDPEEHYLTIKNPTLVALKHPNIECSMFKTFYLPPAINPNDYNPIPANEKDIFISDISRDKKKVPYVDYLDILKRSQHTIIKPGNISVRALEALALKTIPIIIADKDLRFRYRNLGFNDLDNCYFITIEPTMETLEIQNYNEEKANNGYEFVRKNHTWKNRAQIILNKAGILQK
ncbi:MAG: hypothetical protein ACFFG0_18215 [Candidatus Thorarchaeota archaeon]